MSTRRKPTAPTRAQPRAHSIPGFDDLSADLDELLRDSHPLSLLQMTSEMLSSHDPHLDRANSSANADAVAQLCEALDEAGQRQTNALLKLLVEMTDDRFRRDRYGRSIAARRHAIPGWLLRLDQVKPTRVLQMGHVLGDGDNIVVGVALPGNREMSILIYIDHNMGTLVKDAFITDMPVDELIESWLSFDDGPGNPVTDARIVDISPADARARISAAIELGSITFPPLESETWPAIRPLVEWIVEMLPSGGADFPRPEWSQEQLDRLTESFFDSTFGRPFDDDDHRGLMRSFLWFGTAYGPGDPLRWSSVAVEILLIDWIPRKLMEKTDYLAKAPDLLRAFIRFAHAERGIRFDLTAHTLAAVDEFEADFQSAIRTPRFQGPMALLERIGALDGVAPDWFDGMEPAEYRLGQLASEVGGEDALAELTTTPLPDELFAWDSLEPDIHDRVAEVLELVDGCCDALFDVEFRTAVRRFLAEVAYWAPQVFRGTGSARTAAAAMCWAVGKANLSFLRTHPRLDRVVRVKELMAHFGVGAGASQRAASMIAAIGGVSVPSVMLGDADLLIAARRSEILQKAEEYRRGLEG